MINIYIIFSILIIHWIADFVLQTDWEAQNKSKSWNALLSHTMTYSLLWFPIILIVLGFQQAVIFTTITFLAHTITDCFTSRLNSRLWREQKVHNFFVSVGFDQVLHYIQLFLTYYYLKTWV